ncbi:hypothetical protein GMLC_35190 [Geomonas limicola]|uniref:Uncharacterized protein n=1 Tax=Geomonas limicola TaxID=2740186 RepID=A0A6V8NBX0_9BACT|nr:hypothetical protein [Geomonas limicola]GFO69940.1 hypothetical protein GMLC_35190 [Geomonas limicola]
MTDILHRLQGCLATGTCEPGLLDAAAREIRELKERSDQLEEILIMLVRTSIPWDADGNTTENFPAFQERYQRLIHEAAVLLGLDVRSTITRTEPKT